MKLYELQAKLMALPGLALVKLRITQYGDVDRHVELTCVETTLDDKGTTITLSDDNAQEG